MVFHCKMCNHSFADGPPALVLCKHKEGFVHLGCCINDCSWDFTPCEHAVASYDKFD